MACIRMIVQAALVTSLIALAPQAALAQAKPPPANVRIAVMGVANFTPLVVARDKGFFAEENLNVTWTTVNQGAIAVEAVFGAVRHVPNNDADYMTFPARANVAPGDHEGQIYTLELGARFAY